MTFDPNAPLPGAPDPWEASSQPAWRDAPPYAMTEMIAAEPALAERLARRLGTDPALEAAAAAIREAAASGAAIVTTGCGTSEHAAMGAAALIRDGLREGGHPANRVAAAQAFELAADLPSSGVVLGVSHEGGSMATNLALARAAEAGLGTGLITVGGGSPGAAVAATLLLTGEQDQSWCHTVGYLAPLVVSAALHSRLAGTRLDAISVRGLLDAADHVPGAEEAAARLQGCTRILVVGSGMDYVTARELALKLEEGARLPAAAQQLETILHGHLASADATTGLVLLLTDGESRGEELVERARKVLRAASALEMPAVGIVAADLGDDLSGALTPAGRLAIPLAGELPRIVCSVLGSAIPLQLLTERLARARGVNPDTLARENPKQVAAAEA